MGFEWEYYDYMSFFWVGFNVIFFWCVMELSNEMNAKVTMLE